MKATAFIPSSTPWKETALSIRDNDRKKERLWDVQKNWWELIWFQNFIILH